MPSTEYVSKDGSLNDLLAKAYGRKPTEQELDKFCEDARKAADAKAPAFDPEPVLTPEGQRDGVKRAAMREMLDRLTGL